MNSPGVFAPEARMTFADSTAVSTLNSLHEAEALAFLNQRPLHNFALIGFIRDNGLISPLNRGTFYACRSAEGKLEGVALIGHATLFETRTHEALAAFARLAHDSASTHMVIGEQEKVEQFWEHYGEGGQGVRRVCREILLEQRWPVEVREAVKGLRLATSDDIELVMPVQAAMAYEECGVNPLEKDPEGFRRRCARRIELGRTWVWVEDGQLIFKAEVVSDTPEVAYLEGVWIAPQERGKGYGLRCVAQLSHQLLTNTRSVSILVNVHNRAALNLYRKAGYKQQCSYDTIYLEQKPSAFDQSL
ncbi:MAG: GNAT family N-acetyltransferase [Pyrinomonadaceae bacterium]